MKRTKKALALALGAVMSVSACALVACGDPEEQKPEPSDVVVNFVAADGSEWDKDVTFDSKKFKLSLDLNKDKTLSLKGTCSGKAASGGQGGGPGGPGGPGGGFPGGPGGAPAAEEETEPEEDTTDYSQFNFTIPGTWTEEAGWGYTLKFTDGKNTEIVANYDKTSGRHYFYYYMTPKIGETTAAETQVKFEAKDSAYRKTLNAKYVVNEERNATYMFRGGQEGGSGNLSMGYVYLLNGGGVVSRSGTSNNLSYNNKGSWSENKQTHVITMDINGTAYETDAYCDTAGREGYRMIFKSSGGFGRTSTMTLYASCDTSKYTWDKYTDVDFEGAVVETWAGTEESGATYELRLTAKGFAKIYKADGKLLRTEKYAKNGDVLTVGEWISEGDSIVIAWQTAAPNPFTPGENYNITFAKPAA